MARGNKNKKSKRIRQNASKGVPRNIFKNQNEIVRYPFRCSSYENLTSVGTTVFTYELSLSNLGPRCVDAGVTFENFRISELDIRQVMSSTGVTIGVQTTGGITTTNQSVGGVHYLAFSNEPGPSSGVPTSVTVDDLPNVDMGALSHKLRLRIPRKGLYLETGTKWYKTTTTGSPPNILTSAGVVTTVTQLDETIGGNGLNVLLVISGMAEFCTPVAPTAALLRQQLALAEEREKRETFEHCFKYVSKVVNGKLVREDVPFDDEKEEEYCKLKIPVCQQFSDADSRSLIRCPH